MAIKRFIVECDICGREIDATEETFVEKDDIQLCNECSNDETPIFNKYTVLWEAKVYGRSTVHARNIKEAKEKAEGSEVTASDEDPNWDIISVEKSK